MLLNVLMLPKTTCQTMCHKEFFVTKVRPWSCQLFFNSFWDSIHFQLKSFCNSFQEPNQLGFLDLSQQWSISPFKKNFFLFLYLWHTNSLQTPVGLTI